MLRRRASRAATFAASSAAGTPAPIIEVIQAALDSGASLGQAAAIAVAVNSGGSPAEVQIAAIEAGAPLSVASAVASAVSSYTQSTAGSSTDATAYTNGMSSATSYVAPYETKPLDVAAPSDPEAATDANTLSSYVFNDVKPQDGTDSSKSGVLNELVNNIVAYVTDAPAPPRFRLRPQCAPTV
ncbi:hypothetical protein SDRG_03603 [Saprolegnia diclina VS20]|uniref:Uncharacterized protein n=1 Tax=Saprolegnia diclina (strain VS20) TaxID=1156394 RepID=T0QXJ4_SAPDV|nr:hypothetical protein SDRG_03603 [Saprolegnia diclina VS20]EQC39401.1 hypothetical protein SDRG_03603 [Saprolegnia diclina VS20]|eukprot:XP_008607462.1 hypothetical protein SDRG_03603 [Saprolegnia diclina VS20]